MAVRPHGLVLVLLAFLWAGPGWSQCPMCRRGAEALAPEQASALNQGIAALLAPPLALFGLFGYLMWQRRDG